MSKTSPTDIDIPAPPAPTFSEIKIADTPHGQPRPNDGQVIGHGLGLLAVPIVLVVIAMFKKRGAKSDAELEREVIRKTRAERDKVRGRA